MIKLVVSLIFYTMLTVSLPISGAPIKVEIIQNEDGSYALYRAGKPYIIKGAGIDHDDLESLVEHGGNSFRTWSVEHSATPTQVLLDKAQKMGLTVSLGLDFERERHGFDYNDEQAVLAQLEKTKAQVMQYKDHPALLTWIVGNELNFDFKNPKVYDAVNDVVKMIHQVDPFHLVTTTVAGFDKKAIKAIKKRAPDLDFVSFQLYADLVNLPKNLAKLKFTQPYFVTEWGAVGHWEVFKTKWGAPVESTSSEKASNYAKSILQVLQPNKHQIIGNYVFLWGQKQERTATWYGMFLDTGEETEAMDVVHYSWNGFWPNNRAPRISPINLDGKTAYDNVYLFKDNTYTAAVKVIEPDNDDVQYKWEVRYESTATQVGGDAEEVPEIVPNLIENPTQAQVTLKAPKQKGAYRLYVYAYDGKGKAAHANVPFYVK